MLILAYYFNLWNPSVSLSAELGNPDSGIKHITFISATKYVYVYTHTRTHKYANSSSNFDSAIYLPCDVEPKPN